MARIVVAEPDEGEQDLLTYALRRAGHTVLPATDGQEALRLWDTEAPDAVLLAANLRGVDGLAVCRHIRQTAQTPILVVSDRTTDEDVARALEAGADDFIPRPFSHRQLLARLEAVLRRYQALGPRAPQRVLRVGDLALDVETHQVTRSARTVQLTPAEFRILHTLVLNAGSVVSYSRLVESVWGYYDPSTSLLKAHVSHVRRKLGLPSRGPGSIEAKAGLGYRLVPP